MDRHRNRVASERLVSDVDNWGEQEGKEKEVSQSGWAKENKN